MKRLNTFAKFFVGLLALVAAHDDDDRSDELERRNYNPGLWGTGVGSYPMYPNAQPQAPAAGWAVNSNMPNVNVNYGERSWPCITGQPVNPGFMGPAEIFTESSRCDGDYLCSNGRDERECPQKCIAPKYSEEKFKAGCRQSRQRWQFDPKMRTCQFFVYAGCVKQENSFLTKYECELECLQQSADLSTISGGNTVADMRSGMSIGEVEETPGEVAGTGVSTIDVDEGIFDVEIEKTPYGTEVCDETVTNLADRQYYNKTDRCDGVYSCKNQADEKNCPEKCRGFRYPLQNDLVDCKMSIPRFYYDYETGKCTAFAYGGCADVANMFETEEECARECKGVTAAPFVPRSNSQQSAEVKTTPTMPTEAMKADSKTEAKPEKLSLFQMITPATKKPAILVPLVDDTVTTIDATTPSSQAQKS